MCGRATLTTPPEDLAEFFGLDEVPQISPRYNVAPTQPIAVIRVPRKIELLRWGLVPWFMEDAKAGAKLINARADTVLDKPVFREAARQRRCLVIVDGFFEWQARGKRKQPFYIRREDHAPFALAGLWERKKMPEGPLETCTILTVAPSPEIAKLHDRMPLIVPRSDYSSWIDPAIQAPEVVAEMMTHADASGLVLYPVSMRVNTAANDDPRCVEPQPELFPL
jgi:putative SOS response-associated peptidase YedK